MKHLVFCILYIDKNEDWSLAQTFDSNERW